MVRKEWLFVFVFVGIFLVGSVSALTPVNGCMTFNTAGETYYLTQDLTITQRSTCFYFNYGQNKVFDLMGHTITYDVGPTVTLLNPSFEEGSGGVATNWDFSQAPSAVRTNNRRFSHVGGNYTLVFPAGSSAGQYVESDSFFLQGGVTYHAHFLYFGNGNPYLNIIGVSGACTSGSVDTPTPNSWTYYSCSFTPGSDVNARVRLGINAQPSEDTIIDLVEVSPLGFDLIGSVTGTAGLEILNGTIIQGNAKSFGGNAIGLTISSGDSRAKIHNLVVDVSGTQTVPLFMISSNNAEIYNNSFYLRGNYALDREQLYGIISIRGGTDISVHDNYLEGGFQSGIRFLNAQDPLIYNNRLVMNTQISNGYALELYGTPGGEIYNNIITGQGRGMHLGGEDNVTVYNNTIDMMEYINPEYPDPYYERSQGMCAQGIKVEGRNNAYIYNNTVTITDTPETYLSCPLDLGDSRNVTIKDNVFFAKTSSTPPVLFTPAAVYFLTFDGTPGDLHLVNNTFMSEGPLYYILGSNPGVLTHDVLIESNTLIDTTPLDPSPVIYVGGWPYVPMANVTLLDHEFVDVDPRLFSVGWEQVRDWNYFVDWTLGIRALQGLSPAVGARVTVTDAFDTIVVDDVALVSGSGDFPLHEFEMVGLLNFGATETSFTPYNVTVTYGGETQSRLVDLTAPTTETFFFGGKSPDVNSDGKINVVDLAIVLFNQGRNAADSHYNHLDLDEDGQINFSDAQVVAQYI